MKKRLWFLAAMGILVVALAVPAAFGAVTGGGQNGQNGQNDQAGQNQAFFDQMFDWHQKWLDEARKDGQITPDQAETWQEHFNYMRDFHSKNGFGPMGYMMGGGMMGNFNGGYGGMMGGFNGAGGYGGMMGGGFNSRPGPDQSN